MKKIQNNVLAITTLILGLLMSLIYLFNYLFLEYFSSIGIAQSASTFGYSLLLFFAGATCFKNPRLGKTLMWGYVFGSFIERVLVFLIYVENITFDIFIIPIISSIIVCSLLLNSERKDANKITHVVLTICITSILAFLPKVI